MSQTPDRPLTGAELCALVMRKHSLSLRAFARIAGVSTPTASNWLNGRAVPTDSHALTLAALADLEPAAVLIGLQLTRTDCPQGRAEWRRVWGGYLAARAA